MCSRMVNVLAKGKKHHMYYHRFFEKNDKTFTKRVWHCFFFKKKKSVALLKFSKLLRIYSEHDQTTIPKIGYLVGKY